MSSRPLWQVQLIRHFGRLGDAGYKPVRDGHPVVEATEARRAIEALTGRRVGDLRDEEGSHGDRSLFGVWLVELPAEHVAALLEEEYLELTAGDYTLWAEMP